MEVLQNFETNDPQVLKSPKQNLTTLWSQKLNLVQLIHYVLGVVRFAAFFAIHDKMMTVSYGQKRIRPTESLGAFNSGHSRSYYISKDKRP